MEFAELKSSWKNASQLLEDNKFLTQKVIMNSIKSRSIDITSRFRRELRMGMTGGLLTIVFFSLVGINLYQDILILCLVLLGIALATFNIWSVYKHFIRLLRFETGTKNLREFLISKIYSINGYFNQSKIIKISYGISVFVLGLIVYHKIEHSFIQFSASNIVVYIFLIAFMILSIIKVSNRKQSEYLGDLESCLHNLENIEPMPSLIDSRFSFSHWLLIILIIGTFGMTLFFVISHF